MLLLGILLLGLVRPADCATGTGAPSGLGEASSANFDQAVRYEHGEGVTQDYARAHELYCEAADHGDPRAFFNLGWTYLNGRGVKHDDGIAAFWLHKAADQGVSQAANLLRLMTNVRPSSETGCPPPARMAARSLTPPAEIREIVQHVAPKAGLNSRLVLAVIAAESAFDVRAVSRRNAQGLMQLLPETALRFGVKDPFNAEDNIRGGTAYLRFLLERFDGDLRLALAAYNAGEGAVASYGGVPPFPETVQYIERVRQLYEGPRR